MKSAYELAMERLRASDPDASAELTAEQKKQLAEIDTTYKAKMAESEVYLQDKLRRCESAGETEEAEKIRQRITEEHTRLEEEREDKKNRVRAT